MTPASAPDGLLVVDKPAGPTSHDVVARVRRLARTRRVGHAGTLDPAATGVLVLGIGRATRLLGHLTLTEKAYTAGVRLGVTTTTDDADGQVLERRDASHLREEDVRAAMARLTGTIRQVPSAVSAIKVDGKRAYARVRAGEEVALAAREVTVSRFALTALRRRDEHLDLEVEVVCSSGTYVRALARDLGSDLGVGGSLTSLRRTRVGPYDLTVARTMEQLEERLDVVPLAQAAAAAFPVRRLDAAEATALGHGRTVAALGLGPGPIAALGPDGALVALVEESGPLARPTAVFAPAEAAVPAR